MDLVKSIGYDSSNTEYYLFFSQKYIAIKDENLKKSIKQSITIVLKFISMRKRYWSLIFFSLRQGSATESYELIQRSYNELNDEQKEWFKDLVILY